MKRLTRQAREVWEVPRDLMLGRYPAFVTGGPLPRGHVPVFVFHSLEADAFGRKLQYLADNGYVTLSATEYFRFLLGTRPAPDRAVVLTFDDGRGSLWSVGGPLMRRFGMKGIVFLVPGRTPSRPGPPAPTLEDRRAGAGPLPDRDDFLSWEEIASLTHSGLFEFQSHTLDHSRIHTGARLAGFMTPALRKGHATLDVPLIEEKGHDLKAEAVPLGTPLFESEPRTSEALRFREDPEVRRACVERVAAEGEAFFARRGWAQVLARLRRRRPVAGRFESPEERTAAIHRELAEAKRMIAERTGHEVIHLCYPWHASGPTARRLAREVGYRTAFCGKVPGTPITLAGGDPLAIARIGEDYVELLPGRGRADLAAILRRKWRRRLKAAGA